MDQGPHNPDSPVPCRFAIIGGGLTATSMLCQLVDELAARGAAGTRLASLLAVEIFSKDAEVGPGMPHSPAYVLPFHITNMCAHDMTVRISRPDEFQRWVADHEALLAGRLRQPEGESSAPPGGDAFCSHYPREIMGEYLKSQVDDAVARGRQLGLAITVRRRCEVVDLRLHGSQIYLTAELNRGAGEDFGPFNGALLATGHWSEKRPVENYFSSPWPAEKLRASIPPGAAVGVIGSSLSAIETALTLSSDGHFRRLQSGRLIYEKPPLPRTLTLFSRSGLVPQVRGRIGSRRNRYFTCARLQEIIDHHHGRVRLKDIFDLLDRELTDAYGAAIDWRQITAPVEPSADFLRRSIDRALSGDGKEGELVWQTVLVQVFPVARELYLALSEQERRRFDREFTTLFFMHAATQPVINAEKLLALMEAGVVNVVRLGKEYRFIRDESSRHYEFHYGTPSARQHRSEFSYCVDARGQPRSMHTDSAALTRNLIRRGLVHLDHGEGRRGESAVGGSVLIDPRTHRVIQPQAEGGASADAELFAVGAMTRGQIIDASMAHGLARSTRAVVHDLLQKLADTHQLQ